MKQHGKKARQERALERLKKAKVTNSKGWCCYKKWEESHGKPVPGDEYIQHDCNWAERRDAEIAILKERIARS